MSTTRCRGWCFTFHNYDETTIIDIKDIDCRWMIFQTEKGDENHTDHIQGAMWFNDGKDLVNTKAYFPLDTKGKDSVHLERVRGSPAQNKKYCTKIETRNILNFVAYEKGEMPEQGRRTDLAEILVILDEDPLMPEIELWKLYPMHMEQYGRRILHYQSLLIQEQTCHPKVIVYYGKTGTGKSHTSRKDALQVAMQTSNIYYFKVQQINGTIWIDGYMGQKCVIIEDYRGIIPYHTFLRMLDTYPIHVQTKGGFSNWCPQVIWINSNIHPSLWYPKQDYAPLKRCLTSFGSKIIEMDIVWKKPRT